MISRRNILNLAGSLAVSHGLSTQAVAQAAFPAHPIHLVVPFPPGGPLDYLARLIASRVALDPAAQPWLVENVVGASGLLAARSVARAPRDGYRVLLADVGTMVMQSLVSAKSEIQPLTDFTPVAGTGDMPFVLATRKSLPVTTLSDVVDAARRARGAMTYASAGPATQSALMMMAIARHFNIELIHVPFPGNSQIILELAAERIDMAFLLAQSLAGHGFRRIAVAADRELAQLPGVPPLPPLLGQRADFRSVNAVLAPRDTPPDVVAALAETVQRALTAAPVVEELVKRGFVVEFQSSAALLRRMEQLNSTLSAILRKI